MFLHYYFSSAYTVPLFVGSHTVIVAYLEANVVTLSKASIVSVIQSFASTYQLYAI